MLFLGKIFSKKDHDFEKKEVIDILSERKFSSSYLGLFLFYRQKNIQGDYNSFISKLDKNDSVNLENKTKEAFLSGEEFSITSQIDGKYILIHGSPIGGLYAIWSIPFENTITNQPDEDKTIIENFISQTPIPTILFDKNRHIISYNKKFTDLWSASEKGFEEIHDHPALLDRLQSMRMLPENRDIKSWREKQFSPYLNKENKYDDIWYLPDGRVLKIYSHSSYDGGIISYFQDITKKIELEKIYKKTVQNLQESMDTTEENIALFDSSMKLTAFNDLMNFLCQNKLNIGINFSNFCEYLSENSEIKDYCLRMSDELTDNFPKNGKNETISINDKIFNLSCKRIDTGDILLTFRDVSAQKNYENVISQKAEALEELSHIREMFFRQISYELREPMTAISGFSEVICNQVFGELNEKQTEYISDIRSESIKMLELIDNLIDLVSLDGDISSDDFKNHNLSKIIDNIIKTISSKLSSKNLNIKTDIEPNIEIYCDYTSLRQAILQILYNAIDASNVGDEMYISAKNNDNIINIEIIDQGKGISIDVLNAIYNNKSIKGYGLKYVKRVCDLHNININFLNKQDTGTCVQMKLVGIK